MMGVYFAPEGVEMPAHHANPKGFWERKDVYELCKKLLASAGCDWQRLSGFKMDAVPPAAFAAFEEEAKRIILGMDAHRPWFLKEPRLCVLVPFWLKLLEVPICVFVHRSPFEVARSLEMRNGFSLAFSLALWERYYTAALNATLGLRRIQVSHAELMAVPVATVRNLAQDLEALGVRGLRSPSDEEILAFIDPSLYRAKENEIGGVRRLSAAQRKLQNAFENHKALLATKPIRFSAAGRAALQLGEAQNKIVTLEERNAALSTEVSDLKGKLKELEFAQTQLTTQQNQLTEKARLLETAKEESVKRGKELEAARTQLATQQNQLTEKVRLLETAKEESVIREKELESARTQLATQQNQLIEKLRLLKAAKEEAIRNGAATHDRVTTLNQAIDRRDAALTERGAKVEELAETNRILKQALDTIEKNFSRLRDSSSFNFMVYTARRLGLVSRTPRRCIETIGKQLSETRKALKHAKKAREAALKALPSSMASADRQTAKLQNPGFREFDTETIDRITAALTAPVSIVVPVYNNPEELQRCVEKVLLHTKTPFELIVVDDCSPDPAIGALLETYKADNAVRILRNPINLGFVRSANAGMEASQHDVVLLNSDTEVTPRWLQKLTIAAYSDPRVATVTPFSNAAGAFSVPEIGVDAPIPFPFTNLKMARLTERLSSHTYPRVPTGNGFCMFIKRQVLAEIGDFDEQNFVRGYGEENDFCMRASRAGWHHIIDDSLFVYHRGSSSFGGEKERLLKENRATLDRLYPDYTGLVREFTTSSQINRLRSAIGERLRTGASDLHLDKPRVLFVLHQGSGGVPLMVADLVSKIAAVNQCFLLISTGTEMVLNVRDNDRMVEKRRWKLPNEWSARHYDNAAARQIYFQVLNGLGIDLVHIHHLFKHSFDVPRLCRQLGIRVVLSFHDYYFVCPSIHLLDQNANFCGGRCTPGLQQCTIPSGMLQDLPMLKKYLPEWRGKVAQLLDCCDAFVTPAESVREIYLSAFPQLNDKPFWVIEHGRDFESVASVATAPRPGEPVRILVAGNIDRHKGSHFIRQLKELDAEGLLEFHFLGRTDEEIHHIGVQHGPYERADFVRLAQQIRPSFAAIFSIWAETYSYTLTEAWSVGLPVLGSNLGAVGERIARHGGGWAVDTTDPAATLAQIRQIVTHPATYQEEVQAVKRIQIQTLEEMADTYRSLYDHISTDRKRGNSRRVGCIVPSGARGSTYIRVGLPLGHEEMRQRVLAVRLPARLATNGDVGLWIDQLGLQTIVVQREALDQEAARFVVETCRAKKVRVVFEIDDNLLDLEPSHADAAFVKSKVEAIRYLANSADQVTVSTLNLRQVFLALNERSLVIGNALDEWLWFSPEPEAVRSKPPGTIIAGYMGTLTHQEDLEMVREPFLRARERLLRDYGIRLILQLIGGMAEAKPKPWYERLEVPRGHSSYPRFVRWLRRTAAWDFGLAPLVAHPFNESKSALKFLEYAALGIPGIFSRVGEYSEVIEDRRTGLLTDSNGPEEWEELIIELASSPSLRKTLATNALRQTLGHHLLSYKVQAWLSALIPKQGSIEPTKNHKQHQLDAQPSAVKSVEPLPPASLKADVVVCIYNALEDVRRCLSSLLHHATPRLNRLVLVNDGSNDQTSAYLRQFAREAQVCTVLLETLQPTGYTRAANRGLAATEAAYVILLNSDTIVTPGWIERLIECGESQPAIGIVGPLSNAASWQSVPERYSKDGDWAVNELPSPSLDRLACAFSILHASQYPMVPIVNGFCFAIKRSVINTLGLLDEVSFPNGYGEENDYCLRAGKAGFSLAIADDCYIYHAKSKSYSHATRRELASQAQSLLHQRYGDDLKNATKILKDSPALEKARFSFDRLLKTPPCSILFLMTFRGAGGGINSIIQEANGLRGLGAAVQVAISSTDESYYYDRFPTVPRRLFYVFENMPELISYAGAFEFVVATLFTTVRILKTVVEEHPEVVPCYYVQDYEPSFFAAPNPRYREALDSYTLIPTLHCFAKTRWLCQTVSEKHGVHVNKVEPSLDRDIFFPDESPKPGHPFVICAMVRPSTEHRSPTFTFEILRQIKLEFAEKVEIRMFGLQRDDAFFDRQPRDFEYEVLGILNREGVARILREASLFVDASTYQAFGRTGLEAMACRCATILPRDGGVSEYAVDEVNTLLADPGDAGGVMRQVSRYLGDHEFYRRIVEEGLKTASRYNIQNACVSELQFFESLRQRSGTRTSPAHTPEVVVS